MQAEKAEIEATFNEKEEQIAELNAALEELEEGELASTILQIYILVHMLAWCVFRGRKTK